MMTWTGMGLASSAGSYVRPGNEVFPDSQTVDGEMPPVCLDLACSIAQPAANYNFVAQSLSMEYSTEIAPRENFNAETGYEGCLHASRSFRLTVGVEAETEAVEAATGLGKSWWQAFAAGDLLEFSCDINRTTGTVGERITITAPAAQIISLGKGGDVRRVYELEFALRESSGNDEISIVIQ
jgi:hypothetical protein